MQELFLHGTITTSQAKAAAIKGTVDKIINLAKNKNSQRLLQSFFANKLLQDRLVKEIAPKLQNRTSGYTSQVKVLVRSGDRTTLVKMSLIGLEELKPLEKVTSKTPIKEVKKSISEKKADAGRSVRKTRITKKVASRSSKNKK